MANRPLKVPRSRSIHEIITNTTTKDSNLDEQMEATNAIASPIMMKCRQPHAYQKMFKI